MSDTYQGTTGALRAISSEPVVNQPSVASGNRHASGVVWRRPVFERHVEPDSGALGCQVRWICNGTARLRVWPTGEVPVTLACSSANWDWVASASRCTVARIAS